MIAIYYLFVELCAVAGSLAAPTDSPPLFNRDLEQRTPDFDFLGNVSRLMSRQDNNQDYKTSGNVNYSPTSGGYSVKFSNAQDFVVGKSWTTGSAR
jgi:endo-1,4-beta-xylanase